MVLRKALEDGTLFCSVEREATSPPLLLDTPLIGQNLWFAVHSEAQIFKEPQRNFCPLVSARGLLKLILRIRWFSRKTESYCWSSTRTCKALFPSFNFKACIIIFGYFQEVRFFRKLVMDRVVGWKRLSLDGWGLFQSGNSLIKM